MLYESDKCTTFRIMQFSPRRWPAPNRTQSLHIFDLSMSYSVLDLYRNSEIWIISHAMSKMEGEAAFAILFTPGIPRVCYADHYFN